MFVVLFLAGCVGPWFGPGHGGGHGGGHSQPK